MGPQRPRRGPGRTDALAHVSWGVGTLAYVVRSPQADRLAPQIRALINEIAPRAPMYRVFTMEELADRSMARRLRRRGRAHAGRSRGRELPAGAEALGGRPGGGDPGGVGRSGCGLLVAVAPQPLGDALRARRGGSGRGCGGGLTASGHRRLSPSWSGRRRMARSAGSQGRNRTCPGPARSCRILQNRSLSILLNRIRTPVD